jgi:hypothetical protein
MSADLFGLDGSSVERRPVVPAGCGVEVEDELAGLRLFPRRRE